jgi:polyferredoxin
VAVSEKALLLPLARAVLALHVAFTAFAVLGLVAVVTGFLLRWGWVASPAFRLAHLAAIVVVVVRVWCGARCPLTTAEERLRERAGEEASATDALDRFGQAVVFRGADPARFRRAATAWGALTLALLPLGRTRRLRRASKAKAT